MNKGIVIIILYLSVSSAYAQSWTLKDSGAGLIVTENAARTLKIIKRSTLWDLKELTESGAMDSIYNGNQLFAAWIQGPETKELINLKGKANWIYKYKINYPDGKIFVSETREFLSSGYAYFGIKPGKYTDGIWRIEWFVVNRDNLQETFVATTIFQSTWGEEAQRDHLIIKNK